MTITRQGELDGLREIGRAVANTMQAMAKAMEPGMTTRELDEIGRAFLEREGAVSAPQSSYDFPGATCISVNEEIAHGIPGDRAIAAGDLVNIDVSASKDGFFADTGATFQVAPVRPALERLCRDGERAMQIGIAQVASDRPLANIGKAIGRFAADRGYTLVRNLASHGVGRSLHEYPEAIPTWPARGEKRRIRKGLVLTVEPFLSTGAVWAAGGDDGWTLYSEPRAAVVQYEHTVVATDRGAIVVTLPGWRLAAELGSRSHLAHGAVRRRRPPAEEGFILSPRTMPTRPLRSDVRGDEPRLSAGHRGMQRSCWTAYPRRGFTNGGVIPRPDDDFRSSSKKSSGWLRGGFKGAKA